MVIGVQLFVQRHAKEYRCKSCKNVIKQGEEVAYHFGAPNRFYHLHCSWGGVRVAVLKTSPGVRIDGCVPAERHPQLRAALATALDEARIDLEKKFRGQLERKRSLERSHPIGTRLVQMYAGGRIRFVEVVGYSLMGRNMRLRQVEMTSRDTWVCQRRQFLYATGFQRETKRTTYVLYEAQWERRTNLYHNVSTTEIDQTLFKGCDFSGPYDCVEGRFPVVEEARGARVVNVRTLAGTLIYSVALGDDASFLFGAELSAQVAEGIGLLPARGTVELLSQQAPIRDAEDLAVLFQDNATPLELTAVVRHDPRWPAALDGRRLPYAYLQHVPIYNESLAMDIMTERLLDHLA